MEIWENALRQSALHRKAFVVWKKRYKDIKIECLTIKVFLHYLTNRISGTSKQYYTGNVQSHLRSSEDDIERKGPSEVLWQTSKTRFICIDPFVKPCIYFQWISYFIITILIYTLYKSFINIWKYFTGLSCPICSFICDYIR